MEVNSIRIVITELIRNLVLVDIERFNDILDTRKLCLENVESLGWIFFDKTEIVEESLGNDFEGN